MIQNPLIRPRVVQLAAVHMFAQQVAALHKLRERVHVQRAIMKYCFPLTSQ
jgi:hypothetical protein